MLRSMIRAALALLLLATLLPVAGPAVPPAHAAPGDNAISLNGTTQNIQLQYSGDSNFTGSITIEAWIKRSDITRCETIVGNNYFDSYWFGVCPAIFGQPARLRFYRGDGDSADGNTAIPAGVWTHVAVTFDGTTMRFYINGALDVATTAASGPLRPAPNGSNRPLGIGADPSASAPFSWSFHFQGLIDEVRIWRAVRSQEELVAGMFQPVTSSAPNLALAFNFNGNVETIRAFDDGVWVGAPAYSRDGAIPRDIRIPSVAIAPTLDGECDTGGEYASATRITAHGVDSWLLHTPSDLWVCFDALTTGAAVYLDADFGRAPFAGSDDLLFEVFPTYERARAGDGAGGYADTTLPAGSWDGARLLDALGGGPSGSEFRISKSLIGENRVIGLALASYAAPAGEPRLWPALATTGAPNDWSAATLGGTTAPQTYNGRVNYQTRVRLGPNSPVPGVGVRLVGFDPAGAEAIVGFGRSDHEGNFSITSDDDYPQHRFDLDVATLPRGYTVQNASRSASASFTNVFTLQDAQPTVADPLNGPFFLIVASQVIIDSGVLRPFVRYKELLGFEVEVISVERIDATVAGANRREKVRNLELARLATYGDRFQYVLLIGPHSVIPMAIFDIHDEEGNCITQGLPSDWYYVDLVSPMDSNGNGCIADGIWTDPARRRITTPPDTGISFEPTVALGRLPFTTPAAVRRALDASMRFEQQASADKLQTLAGMAMMDLRARCWEPADDPSGAYTDCNTTGTDGAYLATALNTGILATGGYSMTAFYENFAPDGGSSPSYLTSPDPLNAANVVDALDEEIFGLVNLHGHGNADGVFRTAWVRNANGNATIETPAQPTGDPPVSENEAGQPPFLRRGSYNNINYLYREQVPIYIVAACSTSDFADPANLGATLLAEGKSAGFVGALTTAQYIQGWTTFGGGGMNDLDYLITRNLLGRHLRLGDAVWQGISEYIRRGNRDFSTVVFDLYGDPTLSYWGNGGGQSTQAAWPMLRQNALGSGSNTLVGPGAPVKLWEYAATAPGAAALAPSPLVSNNGEVIVAHGTFVDVIKRGEQYNRLRLDAAAYGAPALAADGTIYALDVNGTLYAFAYSDPDFREGRRRRWTLALGSAPSTSPAIGPDGFIAVGRAGGTLFGNPFSLLTVVRPDGRRWRDAVVGGTLPGALAIHGDRSIYLTTDRGQALRIDPFCIPRLCTLLDDAGAGAAYSTPPLLANGALYAGRTNGLLVKKNTTTLADLASFNAGSAITAGPIAGPDGQILIGTAGGMLYSLNANLGVRWSRSLGAAVRGVPAFSADALYVVSGNQVRAYNPASGVQLWSRALGAGAGASSTAVGYGREVYVQTANGKVFGFGEGWIEPPTLVLAEPIAILPQQSLAGVRVEWRLPTLLGPEADPAGFLVQRSAGDGAWQDVATLPGTARDYTDMSAAPGEDYLYRVKALDANGNDSDFTTAEQEIRALPALPGAPALAPITVLAADQLRLTWTPGSGETTGYLIERAPAPGGPFAVVGEVIGEVTEYTDTELTPGMNYSYRVRARNDLGEGNASNIVSGITRQRTLAAPQGVVATLLPDGRVQITWRAAPAGVTAVIEVNPQGYAGFLPLGTAGAAGPFVYDHGMPSSFRYRVKFVQGSNESAYTETASRIKTSGFVGLPEFRIALPVLGD